MKSLLIVYPTETKKEYPDRDLYSPVVSPTGRRALELHKHLMGGNIPIHLVGRSMGMPCFFVLMLPFLNRHSFFEVITMRTLTSYNEDNFRQIEQYKGYIGGTFSAPWCPPCQASEEMFSQFADRLDGDIQVGKVNVDQAPVLTTKYEIWGYRLC
ncbi:thioredoxin domain-containing protein [Klebsiella pneumoniae subsp. pneumoniae]|nr:thioredoxin domain-containing protein [Klebsiella pneumoniae subsp. pneumoniae]